MTLIVAGITFLPIKAKELILKEKLQNFQRILPLITVISLEKIDQIVYVTQTKLKTLI